jgi:hypothetical protein
MNKMFLFAIAACILFPAAGRNTASEKITVSGEILLVGNVPFVEMIIHDSRDRDWFIEGDDRELLNERVGQEVTVQGFPHETDLRLADGSKTFKRYSLSQIIVTGPYDVTGPRVVPGPHK